MLDLFEMLAQASNDLLNQIICIRSCAIWCALNLNEVIIICLPPAENAITLLPTKHMECICVFQLLRKPKEEYLILESFILIGKTFIRARRILFLRA